MTSHQQSPSRPHRKLRSVGAVVVGFLAVFLLSLGTDQVLHMLRVFPPWGQPMDDPGLNLLALSYRVVYTVFGGYVVAALAPSAPWRHVWALGIFGLFIGIVSVLATWPLGLGPHWYPIALAAAALPGTLAGGALYRTRQRPHTSGAFA